MAEQTKQQPKDLLAGVALMGFEVTGGGTKIGLVKSGTPKPSVGESGPAR